MWTAGSASGGTLELKPGETVSSTVVFTPVDLDEVTTCSARDLASLRTPARRVLGRARSVHRQLADAFQELLGDEQVDLLQALEKERAADVLDEMDPDDAADLIHDLPEELARDLLKRMEPEEAADVRNLLMYADQTAGGMMTPEPVNRKDHQNSEREA